MKQLKTWIYMGLLIITLYHSIKADTITIILNNDQTTVDGAAISTSEDDASGVYIQAGTNIVYYEKEHASETGYGDSTTESEWHSAEDAAKEKLITIQNAGTYSISGTLYGQLAIEGSKNDEFIIYLNGVNITSKIAPGLIFYKAKEIDGNSYEDDGVKIEQSVAENLDFTNAGAKIIIKDGTTNYVTGSHVAKRYKFDTLEDGTRNYTTKKLAKYDAAFYSKVSMSIDGETKKNGILNIVADNEGLDTEKHLLINGGIINIASQDDGINTNEDGGSVTLIKGGTITINAGLGTEGDGIDSNGYLIITGGTLISAAKPMSDSGVDADNGVLINGGNVIAVGSNMDGASTNSSQCSMNLQFAQSITKDQELIIKDSNDKELITFSVSDVDLFTKTDQRYYTGSVISHPEFTLNGKYYIYVDDVQYCYSGNAGGMGGGANPQGSGEMPSGSGEMPSGSGEMPSGSGEMPSGSSGGQGEFNPGENGGNNQGGGNPPDGNSGGQGEFNPGENGGNAQGSSNKEFTLTSKVVTFSNIQKCSEASSSSSNDESEDESSAFGMKVSSLALVLLILNILF